MEAGFTLGFGIVGIRGGKGVGAEREGLWDGIFVCGIYELGCEMRSQDRG